MPLASGLRLGVYEIVAAIGAGGMGEVYRARDARLGRDVAVKVLISGLSADPERLRRFEQEARAAAATNHPHVLAIHDVGTHDGQPFIVCELLEGETLRTIIARGRVPPGTAVKWIVQLCEGLQAAHDRGVVHRDLKPENVFITTAGVKILDFGVAKLAARPAADDAALTAAVTGAGTMLGTVGYMAPEIIEGRTADARSDVFSVGCLLYEMLSGRRPFARPTTIETLNATLQQPPPDLQTIAPDVPIDVARVVQRCLEKEAARRFQSARDVVAALTDRPVNESDRRSTDAVRAHRRRAAAVAGAVLTAVAALALWTIRGSVGIGGSAPAADGPTRVVVLPFENVSGQPSDQWLSGALADSLTLGLRDAPNLVLVSRERVLQTRPGGAPAGRDEVARLARALGVRYYVDGNYQRVGDDLRVIARLVDAASGTIALQETHTDRLANVFQIEDEFARRFAAALRQPSVAGRTARTSSLAAYENFALGSDLYLTSRFSEAVQRLEAAIAVDARYADAWALLSKSYARQSATPTMGLGEIDSLRRKARDAARRAVDLDPSLPESYVALALAIAVAFGEQAPELRSEQIEAWRAAAQKTIDLNPRVAEGYVVLADSYFATPGIGCGVERDAQRAERLYRSAIEIDPLLPAARTNLVYHLAWAGRDADALKEADAALKRLPNDAAVMRARATALLWLRRADEVAEQLRQLGTLTNMSVQDEWELAGVEVLRGHADAAAPRIAAVIERGPVALRSIDTARLYCLVGRFDDAARHARRAVAADASCATYIRANPAFAPYRDQPLLQAVLK